MSTTQMRHTNICFAGKAGNGKLAQYGLDGIREGLRDAAMLYPVFKGVAAGG